MQATYISSSPNDSVKRWRKILDSSRGARKVGASLAEGIHLAQVILASDIRVRSVIVREDGVGDEARALAAQLAQKSGVRVYVLSRSVYDSISPVEHGVGLTVEFEIPTYERPHAPLAKDALYLDGVQDVGNMGTLIRTAVASGVRCIAASSGSAAFWSPKVLRAGMGAHFGAMLFENVSPEELPALFAGRRLAADARGGQDLFRSRGWERGTTVWMMGAEGPGLSEEALRVSDARYLIDIEHACESLNVGAAAAVCLFEQRRRRLLGE